MRHCFLVSLLLVVILSLGQSHPDGKTESQSHHQSASTQSNTNGRREVILATQRNRRLHVFDANTLQQLGYFAVNNNAHSVVAGPDGLKLFIEQPAPPDVNGCCALFALDLVTRKLCKLIFPSSLGAPTPDGRWVFTQRGPIGIEVFDAKTLVRLPRIDAPGLYHFLPSPDSRWLFGITYSQRGQGPSLDIFDIENKVLVRRLPTPDGLLPAGDWLGDQFFLYAYDGNHGNLWKVTPETTKLDAPLKITLPHPSPENRAIHTHHNLIAGGKHLFLYESFGHKLDRRSDSSQEMPGGIFSIEPSSGKIVGYFARSVHFARVKASTDGQFLYGIDSGMTGWRGPVRLLKLDASNGAVVAERALEQDVWFISPAKIPVSAIPQGEVQPNPCESR
jgi:hypothetical protein